MMASVILREGDLADLGAVMSVMESSFDPAYGEAWTSPQCAGLMPMPGVWVTLAEDGAGIAGFAMGRVIADEAELLLLAVKRDRRGRGTGRALLERFEAIAAAGGARKLHLEVRDGNPAIKLYEKAGFSEAGRRKSYYHGSDGQVYDALTFAKLLAR
jgi:ribosomal-protein-alanine N-acetyltransferase